MKLYVILRDGKIVASSDSKIKAEDHAEYLNGFSHGKACAKYKVKTFIEDDRLKKMTGEELVSYRDDLREFLSRDTMDEYQEACDELFYRLAPKTHSTPASGDCLK